MPDNATWPVGNCREWPGSNPNRVLSRNEFLGRKMVRGKCALGRGLGPSPQESVSVLLSKHIHLSVSTGRQELSQCHYLNYNWEKFLGGSLSVWERSPPPSRLNPAK